jgi:hypothetical protein
MYMIIPPLVQKEEPVMSIVDPVMSIVEPVMSIVESVMSIVESVMSIVEFVMFMFIVESNLDVMRVRSLSREQGKIRCHESDPL